MVRKVIRKRYRMDALDRALIHILCQKPSFTIASLMYELKKAGIEVNAKTVQMRIRGPLSTCIGRYSDDVVFLFPRQALPPKIAKIRQRKENEGLRAFRIRRQIIRILKDAGRPLAAKEIVSVLKPRIDDARVGRYTVNKTLYLVLGKDVMRGMDHKWTLIPQNEKRKSDKIIVRFAPRPPDLKSSIQNDTEYTKAQ